MEYLLLTIYLVLVSVCYSQKSITKKKYLIFCFAPLAYFMAFRSVDMPICVDSSNYAELFDYSKNERWDYLFSISGYSGAESGYLIFNKFFSLLSSDYYSFQIFVSVAYCFLFAYFIYKQVNNPIIGLSLFLGLDIYFTAYNISRQMFVVSLFTILIPLFYDKRKILAALLCLVFTTLHTTSFLYLIVPLLVIIPERYQKYVPILLVGIFFLFDQVVQLSSLYFIKYENYYLNTGEHNFSIGLSSIVYISIIALNLYTLYTERNPSRTVAVNNVLSLFSISCIFLGLKLNYMERIGLLFIPYTILAIDHTIDILKEEKKMPLINICIIGMMFMFFCLRAPKEFIHF